MSHLLSFNTIIYGKGKGIMEKMFKEFFKEFKEIKHQINSRFDKLENRFDKLETEVDIIKTQQLENTQILRALEHKAEVHKAEMDNLQHQLAKIEGTLNEIKEDQKSIHEILGEHEVAIRTLRRKPV